MRRLARGAPSTSKARWSSIRSLTRQSHLLKGWRRCGMATSGAISVAETLAHPHCALRATGKDAAHVARFDKAKGSFESENQNGDQKCKATCTAHDHGESHQIR